MINRKIDWSIDAVVLDILETVWWFSSLSVCYISRSLSFNSIAHKILLNLVLEEIYTSIDSKVSWIGYGN